MKRISICLLVLSLLFLLYGCKEEVTIEESNVLKIDLLDAGYGTEFAYKLKEIFEEENPGKTVEIKSSRTIQLSTESKILSGPKNNDVDLFITTYYNYRSIIDRGARAVKGYDKALLDLAEVYNWVDENGKTIKDKLGDEFYNFANYQDVYYAVPWASGPCGFMYNKTLFDHYGWELPKTVSELEAFAKQVNSERASGLHEIYPLVYPGYAAEYWAYVYDTWAVQYEGYENFRAFWEGALLNSDGSYNYHDGYMVYRQEGRLEALKALERTLGNQDYIMPGSSTFDHTTAQSKMLLGQAAIVVSGDWIEMEMSGTTFTVDFLPGKPETEIGYLSTPLLDVVAGWKAFEGQTGVDAATGLEKSVLYQRYLDAGKYAYSLGFQHLALVPAYTNAKTLAIEFLKLMVSDRGCDIFLKYGGSPSPFKQVYTEAETAALDLTPFQLSKLEYTQNVKYITKYELSPIRYKASLANYNLVQPESAIANGASAQELFDNEANYVQSMWNSILISAGIVKIS